MEDIVEDAPAEGEVMVSRNFDCGLGLAWRAVRAACDKFGFQLELSDAGIGKRFDPATGQMEDEIVLDLRNCLDEIAMEMEAATKPRDPFVTLIVRKRDIHTAKGFLDYAGTYIEREKAKA